MVPSTGKQRAAPYCEPEAVNKALKKSFELSLPIDAALPRPDGGAGRARRPPCWSRRPAPARPRACRWCCSTSRGSKAAKDPGAGAAPARRPRRRRAHGLRRWARQVGETVGYRVRFGSKVSRATRIEVVTEGIFTRMILDDPVARGRRRGAVRRIPRALARRRSRPRARARGAAGPARGSEAPGDVGDHRRRPHRQPARRCAGDRERRPRLSGRDPLCRPRPERRSRRRSPTPSSRALRAETGSVLVFLPGAGEIRRTETRLQRAPRRSRRSTSSPLYGALDADGAGPRDRAGAARPAQGRAGDLDRRDLADHRRRARRGRLAGSRACRATSRMSA